MSAVDPFHGTLIYLIARSGRPVAKLKLDLAAGPMSEVKRLALLVMSGLLSVYLGVCGFTRRAVGIFAIASYLAMAESPNLSPTRLGEAAGCPRNIRSRPSITTLSLSTINSSGWKNLNLKRLG